ncbi:hypothetical protein K438DRAFT_1988373 [Mycena galopus ATCC 62051]|nr:hypothetical protein K438DRAFT_1988373 [Mycena galopus ATCC 62051]
MGNMVSEVVKQIDQADEKERIAKEQLEMLMEFADARLDTFEERGQPHVPRQGIGIKDECAREESSAIRALYESRLRRGGVEQAVDAFFGDTGIKGVLDGFKAVVKTGLKTILGDTSAGEGYDQKLFVCIKHNAIICVDMYTYKYNFHNEGVISTHKNLLAYILCVSVLDHRDVTPTRWSTWPVNSQKERILTISQANKMIMAQAAAPAPMQQIETRAS